jgi:hypothetical protein
MSMPLELLIFIGLFALALWVIVDLFLGGTDSEKRKLRAEHEARRQAMLRWDRGQLGVLRSPVQHLRSPVRHLRSPVRQLTPTRPF